MRLLNIGCGNAFHPHWVNLDASPADRSVTAWDVRRGLPFEENSFAAVYGSHVLEHLEPVVAGRLLRECHRVLRPAGIVRLVVPDLEEIARLYLESLEGALAGNVRARQRYDWMMLELYDQAVRTSSGGEMAACLERAMDKEQREFVASRIGKEVKGRPAGRPGMLQRLGSKVQQARKAAAGVAAMVFLGAEGRAALREGLFRRGGEVHRWMYDRFSLRHALEQAGFAGARVCSADDSGIPGFADYGLECIDGRERKPDSLYIEAQKPGGI
ncbi:MAG: methyltransferase domain-containing protein [Steroidobacteraceae bacterium]